MHGGHLALQHISNIAADMGNFVDQAAYAADSTVKSSVNNKYTIKNIQTLNGIISINVSAFIWDNLYDMIPVSNKFNKDL